MKYDERFSFGCADVGDVNLHYAAAGGGERLVVLLHGFPEFWFSWRHQLAALSGDHTVVEPDMRGYNLSDRPRGKRQYDVVRLVDDIVGLIGHFGRETAAVIGHDWGASVAWALAMKRPDVLWKLGALQVRPVPVWIRDQTAAQFFASWYMFFYQLPRLYGANIRKQGISAAEKGPDTFHLWRKGKRCPAADRFRRPRNDRCSVYRTPDTGERALGSAGGSRRGD